MSRNWHAAKPAAKSTKRRVPQECDLGVAETVSGGLSAELKTQPVEVLIDGIYRALRDAVERWGGTALLALETDTPLSLASDRLNRKERNGALQRAFLDWIGVVCAKPDSAQLFLYRLCDLLGFERPKRLASARDLVALRVLARGLRMGLITDKDVRRIARAEGIDLGQSSALQDELATVDEEE